MDAFLGPNEKHIEISFSNFNSNHLSGNLILFFNEGIKLKNVNYSNLINNIHSTNGYAHIHNRATLILFSSIIVHSNSHTIFGSDDGGSSTIQDSYIFGIIGSINYLNLNNSLILKDIFKINHFLTGFFFAEYPFSFPKSQENLKKSLKNLILTFKIILIITLN